MFIWCLVSLFFYISQISCRGSSNLRNNPIKPNGPYPGGSNSLYTAGLLSPQGLPCTFISSAEVSQKYAGNWSTSGVYSYNYNALENLQVECYCMRYTACSCERMSNQDYFDSLTRTVSRFESHNITNETDSNMSSNITNVYVNGTVNYNLSMANAAKKANAASHTSSNSVALAFVLALGVSLL